jgi:hypothetical protein
MSVHRPEVVAQCIAQVRAWQGSSNEGLAPTRTQCGVLADEVERQRAPIDWPPRFRAAADAARAAGYVDAAEHFRALSNNVALDVVEAIGRALRGETS